MGSRHLLASVSLGIILSSSGAALAQSEGAEANCHLPDSIKAKGYKCDQVGDFAQIQTPEGREFQIIDDKPLVRNFRSAPRNGPVVRQYGFPKELMRKRILIVKPTESKPTQQTPQKIEHAKPNSPAKAIPEK